MIILCGGEKGGSGKTTIATNIAVWLLKQGRDVLIVDADPQMNASRWADRRANNDTLQLITCSQKTGEIRKHVVDLAGRYDDVVIDAGGRDSKELRSALLVAHIVLFPLRPSQFDLETIPHLSELLELAAEMRESPPEAHIVLSQCPTHPLIKEAAEARQALEGFPIELAATAVRERRAFREAASQGTGVVELGKSLAQDEINALCAEVLKNGL